MNGRGAIARSRARRHALPLATLLLSVGLCAVAAEPAKLSGRVVHVTDGDTFTLLTPDGQRIEIRLGEVDAPERERPWFHDAAAALAELVSDKNVSVVVQDTDRYNRIVGRVHVGQRDVSAELVERGHVWVHRRYATDLRLYDLETEARRARRGLWSLPEAQQAPWLWRSGRREATPTQPPAECRIKGNISRGGARIYHLPGGASYAATRIDTARGERWFCTEAEAIEAGWQKSRSR